MDNQNSQRPLSLTSRGRDEQLNVLGQTLGLFSAACKLYAYVESGKAANHLVGSQEDHLLDAKGKMYAAVVALEETLIDKLEDEKRDPLRIAFENAKHELGPKNKNPDADAFCKSLASMQEVIATYKKLPSFDLTNISIKHIIKTPSPLQRIKKLGLSITEQSVANVDEAGELAKTLFPGERNIPLSEFMAALYPEQYRRETWKSGILPVQNWVVKDALGKIVGLTGLDTLMDDDPALGEVWLNWFGIAKEKQEGRLGSTLLDWTLEQAHSRGYKTMVLWTNAEGGSGNPSKAQLFYKDKGFRVVKYERVGDQDAVRMEKSLSFLDIKQKGGEA